MAPCGIIVQLSIQDGGNTSAPSNANDEAQRDCSFRVECENPASCLNNYVIAVLLLPDIIVVQFGMLRAVETQPPGNADDEAQRVLRFLVKVRN